MLTMSIERGRLLDYLEKQLITFFPDENTMYCQLEECWNSILERTEYCFSKIHVKYFNDEHGPIFNHLNGDHYSMFLYFAANTLYQNDADTWLCDKIFQLNRALHGIDAYYIVKLPDVFLLSHPLGTVLGKAVYSNYFYALQGCNVGGSVGPNNQIMTPVLGEYVTMQSGSRILGNCRVGNNCMIGSNSLLLNRDLPDNSLYVGNPRDFIIKDRPFHDYNWD